MSQLHWWKWKSFPIKFYFSWNVGSSSGRQSSLSVKGKNEQWIQQKALWDEIWSAAKSDFNFNFHTQLCLDALSQRGRDDGGRGGRRGRRGRARPRPEPHLTCPDSKCGGMLLFLLLRLKLVFPVLHHKSLDLAIFRNYDTNGNDIYTFAWLLTCASLPHFA